MEVEIQSETGPIYFNPVTLKLSPELHQMSYEESLQIARCSLSSKIQPENTIIRARIVITEKCNLRCTYCFVMDQQKQLRDMKPEVLDKTLALIKKFGSRRELTVQIFGGEPLIYIDRIKYIIESLKDSDVFQNCHFEVNTNATLVNKIELDWFKAYKEKIIFSISLDSSEAEINDLYRKSMKGRGSYKPTLNGIQKLQKQGFQIGILYTPRNETLKKLPKLLFDVHKLGIYDVSVNSPQPTQKDWSIDGHLFAQSLLKSKQVASKLGMNFSSELDKIQLIVDEEIPNLNDCTSLCGYSLSFSPEGEVSHCIVNWDKLAGMTQPVDNVCFEKIRHFKNDSPTMRSECQNCVAHSTCGGLCGLERTLGNIQGENEEKPQKCCFYQQATIYAVKQKIQKIQSIALSTG
ncbi:MAG: hypothetical protein DRR19_17960 [Candidatus Parabeggiatoa sp. nov. 1]|nr:MAG: hypothetical protein DRR19_17960 [Gammaproteobacteria bacterium]